MIEVMFGVGYWNSGRADILRAVDGCGLRLFADQRPVAVQLLHDETQ